MIHTFMNGDKQVVNGPIPDHIEGYERDPNNEKLFHPIQRKCGHRKIVRSHRRSCGCFYDFNVCALKNDAPIKLKSCLTCEDHQDGDPVLVNMKGEKIV